jgi:IS30 family transposase
MNPLFKVNPAHHTLIRKLPQQVDNSKPEIADPFDGWQRRSNENFNGLLRQCIQKKRPLSTVIDKELRMIQDRLNNRPRKRLKNYNEVFM